MKCTINRVAFGVSLVALLATAPVMARSHHKLCVPQGTKLSSACQYHGYVHGARAHFKADSRAEHRAQAMHHSTER